jgi:5'(3')-deoxyribonucleotidase
VSRGHLYIDMDGPIIDFHPKEDPDNMPKSYEDYMCLPVTDGCVEAVGRLAERYDIRVLTRAPGGLGFVWAAKIDKLNELFGDVLFDKVIMCKDKHLVTKAGDTIIEDTYSDKVAATGCKIIYNERYDCEVWAEVLAELSGKESGRDE